VTWSAIKELPQTTCGGAANQFARFIEAANVRGQATVNRAGVLHPERIIEIKHDAAY
jgi:hypothetical protein